jgi:protein phosphatase PTC7
MIPKLVKLEKGGEDAIYVSKNVIAIADGVSQWSEWGVDASLYPKNLMYYIQELVENATNNTIFSNPKDMITYAFQRDTYNGSSTIVVMSLDKTLPLLYTGQIGDSGFEIIRFQNNSWTIVEEYVTIQWQFNMPFQLCNDQNYGDSPDVGDYRVIKVENNDVILLATDGIWDNLYDSDILDVFEDLYPDGNVKETKNIAELIAYNANQLSLKTDYTSPFQVSAQQSGFYYFGGKPDDISAIVTQVKIVN